MCVGVEWGGVGASVCGRRLCPVSVVIQETVAHISNCLYGGNVKVVDLQGILSIHRNGIVMKALVVRVIPVSAHHHQVSAHSPFFLLNKFTIHMVSTHPFANSTADLVKVAGRLQKR